MSSNTREMVRAQSGPPRDFSTILEERRNEVRRVLAKASAGQTQGLAAALERDIEIVRSGLSGLQEKDASRAIRLGSDFVRQKHEESKREAERCLIVLEDLLAELKRAAEKRVKTEAALPPQVSDFNERAETFRQRFVSEYHVAMITLCDILAQGASLQTEYDELLERCRATSEAVAAPLSLTAPIDEGTSRLKALWVAARDRDGHLHRDNLNLPVLWAGSAHRFWPPTRSGDIADLMMAPEERGSAIRIVERKEDGPKDLRTTRAESNDGFAMRDANGNEIDADEQRSRLANHPQALRPGRHILHPGLTPQDLR